MPWKCWWGRVLERWLDRKSNAAPFAIDTSFTQWRDETPEIAALPDLKLGGRVMDLHQALIRDADAGGYSVGTNSHPPGTLRAALDAYLGASSHASGSGSPSSGSTPSAGSDPYTQRSAAFDHLLALWTGTDAIAASATTGAASARHMAILAKVYGGSYQNPSTDQAEAWELTFRRLRESYYASLSAQTHFDPAWQAVDWQDNAGLGRSIGNLAAVQAGFACDAAGAPQIAEPQSDFDSPSGFTQAAHITAGNGTLYGNDGGDDGIERIALDHVCVRHLLWVRPLMRRACIRCRKRVSRQSAFMKNSTGSTPFMSQKDVPC